MAFHHLFLEGNEKNGTKERTTKDSAGPDNRLPAGEYRRPGYREEQKRHPPIYQ